MTLGSEIMLQATGLTCQRSRNRLFDNLCFSLDSSEILHVRGANGSGKSTLLRILMGLFTDYEGNVDWQLENFPLFMGHKTGVDLRLTVAENIRWLCRLQGSEASIDEIDRVLVELGLVGYQDRLCALLSEGQRKRVGLARFFLCQNPCWIMDEPFSAIDPVGQSSLIQAFSNQLESGGSIILTSHQQLRVEHDVKLLELTL